MSDLAYQLLVVLYDIVLVLVCGYALLKGGREQRVVAATHFVASLASTITVTARGAAGWHGWQPYILLIDLAALAVFLWVALGSRAFWPLWVAGFHLDAVLTHLVRWLAPVSLPAGYSILQGFWAYPLMGALALGTWRHQRAARHERPA